MAEMTYIKVFLSYLDAVEKLADDERGRLFTAMIEYARSGRVIELRGNEQFVFPFIRGQLDRDREAYEKKVEQCRAAGQAGGISKRNKALLANANKDKDKEKGKGKGEDKGKEKGEDDISVTTTTTAHARTHSARVSREIGASDVSAAGGGGVGGDESGDVSDTGGGTGTDVDKSGDVSDTGGGDGCGAEGNSGGGDGAKNASGWRACSGIVEDCGAAGGCAVDRVDDENFAVYEGEAGAGAHIGTGSDGDAELAEPYYGEGKVDYIVAVDRGDDENLAVYKGKAGAGAYVSTGSDGGAELAEPFDGEGDIGGDAGGGAERERCGDEVEEFGAEWEGLSDGSEDVNAADGGDGCGADWHSGGGDGAKIASGWRACGGIVEACGAAAPPPPGILEVADYFRREHALDFPMGEAEKFIAYNAYRGWRCLPRWNLAADLWVVRMGTEGYGAMERDVIRYKRERERARTPETDDDDWDRFDF